MQCARKKAIFIDEEVKIKKLHKYSKIDGSTVTSCSISVIVTLDSYESNCLDEQHRLSMFFFIYCLLFICLRLKMLERGVLTNSGARHGAVTDSCPFSSFFSLCIGFFLGPLVWRDIDHCIMLKPGNCVSTETKLEEHHSLNQRCCNIQARKH